ncbi:DUF6531 domain-containing protein [Microbulbifer sp. SAOS-129_SWC]|uniref:DUF6531 domain-containing protein n=1 Tax=Microbulbifer sp. SAOS-129_SWC TaxID=3145235 RepID=UPI003216FFB6
MTPERLLEFIPSILQKLQPPPVDMPASNPVALCDWLNRQTTTTPPENIPAPLGSMWPRPPVIQANRYCFADAPSIPQLHTHDCGPLQFVSASGRNPQQRTLPPLPQCQRVADHLIASSGEVAFARADFTLPGPLRFQWQRFYRHSNDEDCGLGRGWRHSLSEQLRVEDGRVEFHSAEGRHIAFRQPAIGHSSYNRAERLLLYRQSLHSYRLRGFEQADRIFRADGTDNALPLVEIRDHCGNALTVDYRDGLPTKIVTSWGRIVEIHSRDRHIEALANGHAAEGQQQLCHYEYLEDERAGDSAALLRECAAGLQRESYRYDEQLLSAIDSDARGTLQFEYDNRQRCHRLHHNTQPYRLSWRNDQHRCTLRSDGRAPRQWTFNDAGQLTYEACGERRQRYLYDYYGNLCQTVAADGRRSFYRYDECGRLRRRTRDGCSDRYHYDEHGALRAVQCGERNWHFAYGAQGLLDSATDPGGGVWQCEYSERGQLLQLRDPENGTVQFDWDGQSQLLSVRRGERHWSLAYDHWHRLTAMTLDDDPLRQWHYGNAGELRRSGAADGEYQLDYDSRGHPCALHCNGAAMLEWECGSDAAPRQLRAADGRRWQLQYNGHGQLLELHGDSSQCCWHYDSQGRLSGAEDASGRSWQWRYDAGGAVSEFRDNDTHWYFQRGDDGTLQQIRNNGGQHCDFHYDAQQRLTGADNGHSAVRFQYDARNLLIAEHCDSRDYGSLSLQHHYDARGWLKGTASETLDIAYLLAPDGDLYGIDANGAAILRSEPRDGGIDWIVGSNRLHRQIRGGRLCGLRAGSDLNWQFEPQAAQFLPPLHAPLSSAAIERDRRGNIVREQRPGKQLREYHYRFDGWGLLTSAECGDFKTYFRYDPFGRRLGKLSTHRRSTRQRRLGYRWYSLGLWDENTTLNSRSQTPTAYLHHPLTGALLCRLRDGSAEHYLLDPAGEPLALLGDGGETLWNSAEKRHTDAWRAHRRIADSETGLQYNRCGYWHPQLQLWLNALDDAFTAAPAAAEDVNDATLAEVS